MVACSSRSPYSNTIGGMRHRALENWHICGTPPCRSIVFCASHIYVHTFENGVFYTFSISKIQPLLHSHRDKVINRCKRFTLL
ncbi:hypothetical protein Tcan_15571 [Toxocara canis]|uniref:Uncharacterized protein n=1 Tax=Toxocara canis TaxID=6265 RepID=A0A0B2VRA5_TOXCA|nr:hypothetical protein Tcan_15571 [Toxocara canis]